MTDIASVHLLRCEEELWQNAQYITVCGVIGWYRSAAGQFTSLKGGRFHAVTAKSGNEVTCKSCLKIRAGKRF